MTNEEIKKAVKKITSKAECGSVYATRKHLDNNEIIIKFGITKEEYARRFAGRENPNDAIAYRQAFVEKFLPEIEALGCKGKKEITEDGRVNIRLYIG